MLSRFPIIFPVYPYQKIIFSFGLCFLLASNMCVAEYLQDYQPELVVAFIEFFIGYCKIEQVMILILA